MKILTLCAAFLLCASPLFAQGEVVDNSSTRWTQDITGNATIRVSTDRPRLGFDNRDEGSLRLTTSGQMNDWAFHRRGILAGESWGSLRELTALSFEWYRRTGFDAPPTPSDWSTKSPVFRIGLDNGAELVWENWYNGNTSVTNDWVSTNLLTGNFWFHNNGVYSLTTGGVCGTGPMNIWEGIARALTIQETIDCFGDANVSSVAVGVGSQWDYQYVGYVDNVVVAFNNNTVVNANFDFEPDVSVVPEPHSVYLLFAGLLMMGIAYRRRIVTQM